MHDLVIPFRHSINADKELIYVLRSAERYIPTLGNIIIVGDSPSSLLLKNIINIPCKDFSTASKYKEKNIAIKLLKACNSKVVSDDFIYSNDDEFLLREYEYKYYHKGKEWDGKGIYAETETNTRMAIGEDNNFNNFNVHCPRIFSKHRLEQTILHLNWDIPYGYSLNTMYAYMNNIQGEFDPDLKIKAHYSTNDIFQKTRGRNFFSISDNSFKSPVINFLDSVFPNQSKWEQ